MGYFVEIGLLALLVVFFSLPFFIDRWRQEEHKEEDSNGAF